MIGMGLVVRIGDEELLDDRLGDVVGVDAWALAMYRVRWVGVGVDETNGVRMKGGIMRRAFSARRCHHEVLGARCEAVCGAWAPAMCIVVCVWGNWTVVCMVELSAK